VTRRGVLGPEIGRGVACDGQEPVKLRRFAGPSIDDDSRCLGLSHSAAYRHWAYARAWLLAERPG
jgi:hypothetical protein